MSINYLNKELVQGLHLLLVMVPNPSHHKYFNLSISVVIFLLFGKINNYVPAEAHQLKFGGLVSQVLINDITNNVHLKI